MHGLLVAAILITLAVSLGLALLTAGNKAWRDGRERRRQARTSALAPLVLAYVNEELDSLGRPPHGTDRAVLESLLLDAAAQPEGRGRERAARSLDELGYVDRYLAALRSRGWWRRAEAAERLGQARAHRAAGALATAMADPVAEVGLRAARALSTLEGVSAVGPLLGLLNQPNRWATIRVADILVQRRREAASELCEAFPQLGHHGQLALLDILGAIRSVQAAPRLRQLLTEPQHPDVHTRAADALGRIGVPESGPVLVGSLGHTAWPVRAMAAKALGRIGYRPAIPELCLALRDPEWWVRADAAAALRELGPDGIDALKGVLDDADRYAAHQAAWMLEESGVVDEDVGNLAGGDPARQAAARALVEQLIGMRQVQRLRELATSHPDPRVRRALIERLSRQRRSEAAG